METPASAAFKELMSVRLGLAPTSQNWVPSRRIGLVSGLRRRVMSTCLRSFDSLTLVTRPMDRPL